MTVDVFSSLVSEFLWDHDSVFVQGIGVFCATIMPASVSDSGFTINPPYRKVSLVDTNSSDAPDFNSLCAKKHKLSEDEVRRSMLVIVGTLKKELQENSYASLPNLGKLRFVSTGDLVLIPNVESTSCPDIFGLEKVSMKSKTPATLDETPSIQNGSALVAPSHEASQIAAADSTQGTSVDKPAEQSVIASEPIDDTQSLAEQSVASEPIDDTQSQAETSDTTTNIKTPTDSKKKKSFWAVLGKTLWVLLIISIVLLAAYLLVARFYPELLDAILYSPEELEIINMHNVS